jgi:hypothetical protein
MTHGLEIRKANGVISLSTKETVVRFVHIQRVGGSFSGTFSVPDFDGVVSGGSFTGSGFFYVQYVIRSRGDASTVQPIYGAMITPTLNWNNTTKVMTVSPASIPSQWPFRPRPDYDIIFLHFR